MLEDGASIFTRCGCGSTFSARHTQHLVNDAMVETYKVWQEAHKDHKGVA